jgi:hypothetical protein
MIPSCPLMTDKDNVRIVSVVCMCVCVCTIEKIDSENDKVCA